MPATANPFPGLRAFEPAEDYLFFGREKHIDDLLSLLRRTRFLTVVGNSGSGKSSLVRAGLVPALYGGAMTHAGSHWRVATFRPGEDPLGRMACALSECALLPGAELQTTVPAILEATLRTSSQGLAEAFRLARLPEGDNLLLVVDQFEELFRYEMTGAASYLDDAAAFVKLLLAAATFPQLRIYVVLTLRSDFIGSCAKYAGLPAAMREGQYLVPRLSRSEMRDAITGPIGVGGAAIAPRLTVRLLNEIGEESEQLPVLQHALMRTWDYWSRNHAPGEPLDFRHYEAVGTMASALSMHADEAYAGLATDRERAIAEKVFKALIDTDEQGRSVRRPTSLQALSGVADAPEQEVKSVVESFREAGRAFLAPPPAVALHSTSVLDLSHESLMRVWTRLSQWLAEERQSAEFFVRLARAAKLHAEGNQSLWRNPELSLGLRWLAANKPTSLWAHRYHAGFEEAIAFLERSRKAEQQRRLLFISAISAAVLVALAAVILYALAQRSDNQRLTAVNRGLAGTVKTLENQVSELRRPTQAPVTRAPAPEPSKPAPAIPPALPKAPKAKTVEPPAPPLSAFATEMLAAHNMFRQRTKVPALSWSDALVARAAQHAMTLLATGNYRAVGTGENTADSAPPGWKKGSEIVAAWAAEITNFDYEKNVCINTLIPCHHYTQVVWRDSRVVGCATAHDARRDVWVCDYDPPGNDINERPF